MCVQIYYTTYIAPYCRVKCSSVPPPTKETLSLCRTKSINSTIFAMDDLDQQLAHLQLMNTRDLSPMPPGLVKKVGPAVPPKPKKVFYDFVYFCYFCIVCFFFNNCLYIILNICFHYRIAICVNPRIDIYIIHESDGLHIHTHSNTVNLAVILFWRPPKSTIFHIRDICVV